MRAEMKSLQFKLKKQRRKSQYQQEKKTMKGKCIHQHEKWL
jgi:hypothetical protein